MQNKPDKRLRLKIVLRIADVLMAKGQSKEALTFLKRQLRQNYLPAIEQKMILVHFLTDDPDSTMKIVQSSFITMSPIDPSFNDLMELKNILTQYYNNEPSGKITFQHFLKAEWYLRQRKIGDAIRELNFLSNQDSMAAIVPLAMLRRGLLHYRLKEYDKSLNLAYSLGGTPLEDRGIIRVGAKVGDGDILIGKVTPKGETDPTPEEKLLRAIFGEKAGEVKDASKRADPGVKGVVIGTKLFEKRSKTARAEEKKYILEIQKKTAIRKKELKESRDMKLMALLKDQVSDGIRDISSGRTLIKKGTKLTAKRLNSYNLERFAQDVPWVQNKQNWRRIKAVWRSYWKEWRIIEETLEKDVFKLRVGDELQPGILKLAKVDIANKRKIQVGDKMAGRHGNKGVVATVVPEEDMPYLEDGTPVDVILNPLGVPSRMNLGQLYETMLGWAGEVLGVNYSTPVFNGATPDEVEAELKKAGLPINGKTTLIDGCTGEKLDNPVTVGNIYMMKLSHMVDDKMHARSTGPYSLVTQQPLGGKAQFGGQRFGEMECWALEAYGAAHTLQEILTVKSDDVDGRSKVYNAIVKGEDLPAFGVPESFNVLIKELQGLGLDIELD